jgi:hypothetical protein
VSVTARTRATCGYGKESSQLNATFGAKYFQDGLQTIVERESFAMLVVSIFLLCIVLASRLLLGWYCKEKLGIARERLRDQILRTGHVVLGSSH